MKGAFWASWQGAEEHSGCIQSKSSPLLSPASKQRFDKKQILVTAHYQKVLEAIYKEPMLLLPHLSTLTSLFFFIFYRTQRFFFLGLLCFPLQIQGKKLLLCYSNSKNSNSPSFVLMVYRLCIKICFHVLQKG